MTAHRTALLLVALTFGVCACGGSGDSGASNSGGKYPSSVEDTFMTSCNASSGGKKDACKCALSKLEDTVSYADFKEADAAVRKGKKASADVSKKMSDAISSCT